MVSRQARTLLQIALAALVLAGAAAPARADDDQASAFVWETQPTQADYLSAAPPDAVRDHIDGEVLLRCAVGRTGQMERCSVASETPAGLGFGESALRLSGQFKAKLDFKSRQERAGETIEVKLRFNFGGGDSRQARRDDGSGSDQAALTPIAAAPPPPPPRPTAPPASVARFTPPAGRLANLGMVPGWQATFLDLDGVARQGATVEIVRMTVFARPRLIGDRYQVFEVGGTRFDCAAGSHQSLGAQSFDRDNALVDWTAPGQPEANEPGTLDAGLAALLCRGAPPARADVTGAGQALQAATTALAGP